MKSELLLYRFRKICCRLAFVVFSIIFLIAVLFPPYYLRNYHGYEINLGFHFIFSPPLFVSQYPGSINSGVYFTELSFMVFFAYILARFFGRIFIGAEYEERKRKEFEESRYENLMNRYTISHLWEHILYNSYSPETLQELYSYEYKNFIEEREKLPLRERAYFDINRPELKPHITEMAVISALLDDVELYDKLVDYLYYRELDFFDSMSSAGCWVEKARDIAPRRAFNKILFDRTINYLKSNQKNGVSEKDPDIEQVEDRLNVFNVIVEYKMEI